MKEKTNKTKSQYNIFQNIGFMFKLAWRNRKSVLLMCLIYIILLVLINITQLFVAPVILKQVENNANIKQLLSVIALFALSLALLNGAFEYVNTNTMFGRIDIRQRIITALNTKTCTMSYPLYMDEKMQKKRDFALEVCASNNSATEKIWLTMSDLMVNIICFIVYVILLSNLKFYLILIVVLTAIISFIFSQLALKWEYNHRDEVYDYEKKANYLSRKAHSVELAKDIRIFGLASWINSIYDDVLKLYDSFVNKREKHYIFSIFVDFLMTVARNLIAYIFLINMVLKGSITTPEFLLYFTAFTGFSTWVTGILNKGTELFRQSTEISSVQEYLNTEEVFRFSGGKEIPKADTYEIELKNVSFSYPESEIKIIDNLSLKIRQGEKLAIVGLNGAGKSTLVKLICGFYDPCEGSVLLNGINIKEFNRDEYYSLFSAVFQDYSILDATIKENVVQDNKFNDEKFWNCLDKAGLKEEIENLKDKENSHLGKAIYLDGITFSGGQSQRLMLARALYKEGKMLVLDEPTSALDPLAENDIYNKYNEMTKGKTSIFISHRLASTRFCDRVLYLENGEIAEEGTHDELLKKQGKYSKLFNIQARYYKEGKEFDDEEFKDFI